MTEVRFEAEPRVFSPPSRLGATPYSIYSLSLLWIKRPECKTDHSSPSAVEITIIYKLTTISPLRYNGVIFIQDTAEKRAIIIIINSNTAFRNTVFELIIVFYNRPFLCRNLYIWRIYRCLLMLYVNQVIKIATENLDCYIAIRCYKIQCRVSLYLIM